MVTDLDENSARGSVNMFWKLIGNFRDYILDLGIFWIFIAVGVLLSALLLLVAENTWHHRVLGHASENVGLMPDSTQSSSYISSDKMRDVNWTKTNTNLALSSTIKIREEIHELSNQIVSQNKSLVDSVMHVSRQLYNKIDSMFDSHSEANEREVVNYWNALYITCICMFGPTNYNAKSKLGKLFVLLDSFWGLLTFSLMTAVFLEAIRKTMG